MDEERAALIAEVSESQSQINHTRDVHFLSWAFLLIFLAYGAAQNLQSTINTVCPLSFYLLLLTFTTESHYILYEIVILYTYTVLN